VIWRCITNGAANRCSKNSLVEENANSPDERPVELVNQFSTQPDQPLFAGRDKSTQAARTQNQALSWADPEYARRSSVRIMNFFEYAVRIKETAIRLDRVSYDSTGITDASQVGERGIRVIEGRPLTALVDKPIFRELTSGPDEVAADDRTFAIDSVWEG